MTEIDPDRLAACVRAGCEAAFPGAPCTYPECKCASDENLAPHVIINAMPAALATDDARRAGAVSAPQPSMKTITAAGTAVANEIARQRKQHMRLSEESVADPEAWLDMCRVARVAIEAVPSVPLPAKKPTVCIGEPIIARLRAKEAIELNDAVLLPASDLLAAAVAAGSPRSQDVAPVAGWLAEDIERALARLAQWRAESPGAPDLSTVEGWSKRGIEALQATLAGLERRIGALERGRDGVRGRAIQAVAALEVWKVGKSPGDARMANALAALAQALGGVG